ncbi:hypothetical protein, partial [Hypericibacter sp.]|uniref:hypothetical protein n=1 Tax=Hypericibacter sp. TaxID=2705401 RepID=UPI003D6D6895
AFMKAVVGWEPRVLAIGADSFFKIIIRRHPSAVCWSWALEWNRQFRVIGFFGARDTAETIVKDFPVLKTETVANGPDEIIKYRTETALADDDDLLFDCEQPIESF